MAQPTPATQDKQAPPQPLQLSAGDVVGAIQRLLSELNYYLSAPAQNVDPRVIMGALERCAELTTALPVPASDAGTGANGKGGKAS